MTQIKSLRTGIKFKDTPIGKIPVDWEVTKLGDVVTAFYNGGTPDTKKKEYWDGVIPWITGADFINQKVGQIRKYITPEGVKNSATNIVPKGNLLVVTRTGVGKLAIAPFDLAISQDISGVIPDNQKTVSDFLFWNLNYNDKNLKTLRQGTSINGILREDLSSFLISLPPLPEQKKIAEILTTVDDAIEETDRIIEKTKELKKGLMQKLLTYGIGHKKFKKTEIGEIPVEWEVVRLNKVVKEFYNGGTPDTKVKEYWNGNIPWVTGADFINQRIDQIRRYITMEGVKNSATNLISKGNLLIVTRTGVGKLAIAPFDIAISQDITGVITNTKRLLPDFLYRFLDYHEKKLKSLVQGTSINGLLREDLASLNICLPPLEEQKEITDILTTLDLDIDNEKAIKQTLESLKKSLMQVLLTGRVRV
ncbi:MAG: restriction endonuclease subunit S [Thermodesulfovibrionales bacterium]